MLTKLTHFLHQWLSFVIYCNLFCIQAPLSVGVFGDSVYSISGSEDARVADFKAADLVINGTLMETNVFVYGEVVFVILPKFPAN